MRAAYPLSGLRILLAEDHYFIAQEMAEILSGLGAEILGPAGTVAQARQLGEQSHDMAFLNVDLHGQPIFPVAAALLERGVPIAFVTGYDPSVLPARFRNLPRVEKPVSLASLTRMALRITGRDASSAA